MTDERPLQWLSRNWLRAVVSIALLIVAGSIFYYFVLFLPEEQAQTKEKAQLLARCLGDADNKLIGKWDDICHTLKKGTGCTLPEDLANDLKTHLRDEKEICFKKYPQQ